MSDQERGVYMKYQIHKADGSPCDPDATYFVLRLDKDPAARAAMLVYAEETDNEELANDILGCLEDLAPPHCNCREANCSHARSLGLCRVWQYGQGSKS